MNISYADSQSVKYQCVPPCVFSLRHFGHFFAETFWSLKHIRHSYRNDLIFFRSFEKHFSLWPKKKQFPPNGDKAETLLFRGQYIKHFIMVYYCIFILWSWQMASYFYFGSFQEMKRFMFFKLIQKLFFKIQCKSEKQICLNPNSYHCYWARLICNPTQRYKNKKIV